MAQTPIPKNSKTRFTATLSHQKRSKKRSSPSATSSAPPTTRNTVVVVAQPAERAQGAVEADADGEEREREAGGVDRGAGACPPRPSGPRRRGRGCRPSTGPTHGAAQRPKAAPRSAAEPVPARPRRDPGATSRSRKGSGRRPIIAKPRTTMMSPATARRSSRFSPKRLPAAAAAAPSATKTAVKPADERQTREDDAPAAHAHVLARDHGQVAGNERQDARGGERDEPGGEGQRDLPFHRLELCPVSELGAPDRRDAQRGAAILGRARISVRARARCVHPSQHVSRTAIRGALSRSASSLRISLRSGRALRRPGARAPGRAGARRSPTRARPAPPPAAPWLQRRSAIATATIAIPPATSGSTQASRLKPDFGGAASTPSPKLSTSAASISLRESPAAIRSRMNDAHAVGDRALRELERSCGRSGRCSASPAREGRVLLVLPAAPGRPEREQDAGEEQQAPHRDRRVQRELACSPRAAPRSNGADDVLADEPAVAPDEPRLRESRCCRSGPGSRPLPSKAIGYVSP